MDSIGLGIDAAGDRSLDLHGHRHLYTLSRIKNVHMALEALAADGFWSYSSSLLHRSAPPYGFGAARLIFYEVVNWSNLR